MQLVDDDVEYVLRATIQPVSRVRKERVVSLPQEHYVQH
jgi:hypothetical protein